MNCKLYLKKCHSNNCINLNEQGYFIISWFKENHEYGNKIIQSIIHEPSKIEDKLFSLNPEKVVYDINSFIKMQNEMKENEYLSLELVSCEQLSKSEYLSVYKIEIEDMITGQIYESTNEVDRVHSPPEKAVGTTLHELWDDIEKDREAEKQKSDTRGR